MKVLSKIKVNELNILENNEMKKIGGGTSLNVYCCTLYHLIINNGSGWSDGAWEGANYGLDICENGGWNWGSGC